MKTFKNFITEDKCDLVGMKQIKAFESIVDKLFKKYGIDFKFTRHFGDRMGDDRNNPCISMKELAEFIKDMQTNLNIPVAVKYDQRKDEFDVVLKTIMRKKDFKTPDKIIRYA
jgi:hypothetical protein